MGPIQVVVTDANNLVLEVTPTPETSIVLDRGVAGPVGIVWQGNWSSATYYSANAAVYYAPENASYICILGNTNQLPTNATYWQLLASGAGNVTGAASSTDNAVVRFDGTTGKLIQNSAVIISDAGAMTVADLTDSSLTSGRVVYAGAGGNLIDSANLTFNGTTATANALTVTNAVTLNGGTANSVAYLNGSKVLTTGSELQFDGSNLGLGATPSAWGGAYTSAFQLKSGGSLVNNQVNDLHLSNNCFFNGTSWLYTATNTASRYEQFNGEHFWFNAASGTAGNAITFTQAMTLTAAGDLGVGTSSPARKLDVNGAIRLGNAQALEWGGVAYAIVGDTAGALQFKTASTERMRIDSSGNVIINATSIVSGEKVRIEATNAGNVGTNLRLTNTGTISGTGSSVSFLAYTNATTAVTLGSIYGIATNATGNGALTFLTANAASQAERMRIDTAGNVGIGTTSPATKLDVNGTITATQYTGINGGTF